MKSHLKVTILTEGGRDIGFGHITRCFALYDAFLEIGLKPEFIIHGDESITGLFNDKRYKLLKWFDNPNLLINNIFDADIAIIDSYLADSDIYIKIADAVKIAVFMDDNNRIKYPNGVVINGAIYAHELDYPCSEGVHYLLGPSFQPLRREFWNVPEKIINDEVSSVMITFGGEDIRNLTPGLLQLLKDHFPTLKKNVIIGKGYRNVKEIESIKDESIQLYYGIGAGDMKDVMLKSDIAISAGGQTLYELARIGVPTIAVAVAENQIRNIEFWERVGFTESFIFVQDEELFVFIKKKIEKLKDKNIRIDISKKGKDLVSGIGAKNIVNYLLNSKLI